MITTSAHTTPVKTGTTQGWAPSPGWSAYLREEFGGTPGTSSRRISFSDPQGPHPEPQHLAQPATHPTHPEPLDPTHPTQPATHPTHPGPLDPTHPTQPATHPTQPNVATSPTSTQILTQMTQAHMTPAQMTQAQMFNQFQPTFWGNGMILGVPSWSPLPPLLPLPPLPPSHQGLPSVNREFNRKLYVSGTVAPAIIHIESVRDLMVSGLYGAGTTGHSTWARETIEAMKRDQVTGVEAARKMLLEFRSHGVPLLVTTGGKEVENTTPRLPEFTKACKTGTPFVLVSQGDVLAVVAVLGDHVYASEGDNGYIPSSLKNSSCPASGSVQFYSEIIGVGMTPQLMHEGDDGWQKNPDFQFRKHNEKENWNAVFNRRTFMTMMFKGLNVAQLSSKLDSLKKSVKEKHVTDPRERTKANVEPKSKKPRTDKTDKTAPELDESDGAGQTIMKHDYCVGRHIMLLEILADADPDSGLTKDPPFIPRSVSRIPTFSLSPPELTDKDVIDLVSKTGL